MLKKVLLTFVSMSLFAPLAIAQKTIVDERKAKLIRGNELERLSYGPDDSYQVSAADGELYFALKTYMSPRIAVMDLGSFKSRDVHDSLREADQPRLSHDGERLVYRSMARSPEGEICVYSLRSRNSECPNLQSGEKNSPFWIDNQSFGYLRKDNSSGDSRLESYNLQTKTFQELTRGRVFHPSYQASNQTLVWVERTGTTAQNMMMAKLGPQGLGRVCPVRLTWPGLSGFPKISQDGKRLVFTHYMMDTNADGRIDAEDASMIAEAALPSDAVEAATCNLPSLAPQAVTSLKDNCSQPSLMGNSIYMSCAADGSLDLYRMTSEGVIPKSWTKENLLSAHQAARSPEERLLYLLALDARFPGQFPGLRDGFFSQHILMNDEAGALPYSPDKDRAIWLMYLQSGQMRKTEPPGEISLSLRDRFTDLIARLKKEKPSFLREIALVRAVRLSSPNNSAVKGHLQNALRYQKPNPLEFMAFSMEWENLASKDRNENLYVSLLKTVPFQSPNSDLIYWSKTLERLEDTYPLNRISERKSYVESWQKATSARVQKLLELELLAMKVSEKSKDAYLNFDRVYSNTREDSTLIRLASYRAIHMWTRTDNTEEVESIGNNLLKFIPSPSLEWTYARDYFVATAFDRAYEWVRSKNPAAALGNFYGAAVYTEDLEAYWGYLVNMVAAGRSSLIKRNIDDLKKRNFIGSTENFIRDLAELAEARDGLPKDPETWLATAKSDLPSEDPMGNFILGSVRLQWLMNTSLSDEKRIAETEKARLELLYALDGARDNERLRLSLLTQLGLLSSWAKEWGAAQRYWQQRLRSPFESQDEKRLANYLRAYSLMGIQDFQGAAEFIKTAEMPSDKIMDEPVFHLKLQILSMANRHDEVLALLPKTELPMQNLNQDRRAILFARSLLKKDKGAEACKVLGRLDKALLPLSKEKLSEIPNGRHPLRLRILALGYRSQCATGAEALPATQEYQNALEIPPETRKQLAFSELNFLEMRMKNRLRTWMAGATIDDATVTAYMQDLETHRNEAGSFVQLGQFEAMQALGALLLAEKPKISDELKAQLAERMESFLKSAKSANTLSDLVKSQEIRLQTLREALNPESLKVGGVRVINTQIQNELAKLKDRNPHLGQLAGNFVEWVKRL